MYLYNYDCKVQQLRHFFFCSEICSQPKRVFCFLLKNTHTKKRKKKKKRADIGLFRWNYIFKKILIDPSNNILVCRATLTMMSYFLEKSMEFATQDR